MRTKKSPKNLKCALRFCYNHSIIYLITCLNIVACLQLRKRAPRWACAAEMTAKCKMANKVKIAPFNLMGVEGSVRQLMWVRTQWTLLSIGMSMPHTKSTKTAEDILDVWWPLGKVLQSARITKWNAILRAQPKTELIALGDKLPHVLWTWYFVECQGYDIDECTIYFKITWVRYCSKRMEEYHLRCNKNTPRLNIFSLRITTMLEKSISATARLIQCGLMYSPNLYRDKSSETCMLSYRTSQEIMTMTSSMKKTKEDQLNIWWRIKLWLMLHHGSVLENNQNHGISSSVMILKNHLTVGDIIPPWPTAAWIGRNCVSLGTPLTLESPLLHHQRATSSSCSWIAAMVHRGGTLWRRWEWQVEKRLRRDWHCSSIAHEVGKKSVSREAWGDGLSGIAGGSNWFDPPPKKGWVGQSTQLRSALSFCLLFFLLSSVTEKP